MKERYSIETGTWIDGNEKIDPKTPQGRVATILRSNGTRNNPSEADDMMKNGYTPWWVPGNKQFHGFGVWKRYNSEASTWEICVQWCTSLSCQGETETEMINKLYGRFVDIQSLSTNTPIQSREDISFVTDITVLH